MTNPNRITPKPKEEERREPWLLAAVPENHADLARELAKKRATEDRRAGRFPDFYVVWSPDVLGKEEYCKLILSLGHLVRKAGGVGVTRILPEMQVLSAEKVEIGVDGFKADGLSSPGPPRASGRNEGSPPTCWVKTLRAPGHVSNE